MLRALLLLGLLPLAAAPASASAAAPVSSGVHVVGHGTPASCTGAAFRRAVAKGGTVRFDCGPGPVTIRTDRTATVPTAARKVVIDGGGRVTLDGGGDHRILLMDTCDPSLGITTSHCQDQATPRLVLRGLMFTRGNSTGQLQEGGGGGAVLVRGGRLRVADSTFTRNRCDPTGPDLGGAALRVLDQYQDRPVRVTGSTFTRNRCSNGAGLSSIGVSWVVRDSVFRDNRAVGRGANPARPGTPGGGSGAGIYLDGDDIHLTLEHTTMSGNRAREGGGAIFFVSNDRTGTLAVRDSRLTGNPSEGFETYPGIFYLGHGTPDFSGSVVD
jgi:hypothetical protein